MRVTYERIDFSETGSDSRNRRETVVPNEITLKLAWRLRSSLPESEMNGERDKRNCVRRVAAASIPAPRIEDDLLT